MKKKYRPVGTSYRRWSVKAGKLYDVVHGNNLDQCILPDSARFIMRIRHGLM